MQAGDTLQSIAQTVYGNSNLWYVIADANAIGLDSSGNAINLVAGTTLKLPAVSNSQNSSQTFAPYNPLKLIGSTTPALAAIPPPPPQQCNDLTTLIVVAVTVVVTAYTAGAMAEEMAQVDAAAAGGTAAGTAAAVTVGGTFQTGLAVLSGGTLGSTAALSTAATLSTAELAGAAFVGGVVGSTAGQIVANAAGQTDHVSLTQALAGGLTAMAGSGISAELGGITKGFMATGHWADAALSGAANGLAGVAANRVVGLPSAFSWASVAAAALAAGLGAKLDPTLDSALSMSASSVAGDALNGLVSGAINLQARRALGLSTPGSYGQVAADAFGNALGDYLDGQDQALAAQQPQQAAATSNPGNGIPVGNGDILQQIRQDTQINTSLDLPNLSFHVAPLSFSGVSGGTTTAASTSASLPADPPAIALPPSGSVHVLPTIVVTAQGSHFGPSPQDEAAFAYYSNQERISEARTILDEARVNAERWQEQQRQEAIPIRVRQIERTRSSRCWAKG